MLLLVICHPYVVSWPSCLRRDRVSTEENHCKPPLQRYKHLLVGPCVPSAGCKSQLDCGVTFNVLLIAGMSDICGHGGSLSS